MARTGRFLLDTNIVIALFAREAAVQQRLAEASEVFVPSIVLGELYYGARKSTRVTENLARIDEFVASSTGLPCDTATAQQYGDIKNKLRAKGRPIPENDIWIAAIAMQYQLTLVARDGHFHEVDGLRLGRDKARYLVGTFPHPPRLEPDLRLSPHPAQHLPISLGLCSVA